MIEHEALAGQQQAQQQRQIEERARQAQLDRNRAKQLKANRQQHQPAGGSADVKGKKRARDDDDEKQPGDENERTAKDESVATTRQGPSVQPFKKGERVLLVGEGEFRDGSSHPSHRRTLTRERLDRQFLLCACTAPTSVLSGGGGGRCYLFVVVLASP